MCKKYLKVKKENQQANKVTLTNMPQNVKLKLKKKDKGN